MHHQLAPSVGTTSSFTNKADISVTDGINSEYKQEPRQSLKDARPARKLRQPTSYRRSGNYTRQYRRDGGAPSHQPALDKGIRATHQTDAMLVGSATGPGRPSHHPSGKAATPLPSHRGRNRNRIQSSQGARASPGP